FFSLARFIASTFSSSGVSTNGPFFSERLIPESCRLWALGFGLLRRQKPRAESREPLLGSPLHDEPIRVLATARLEALRRLAPRRHRMPAAGRLAFTAAERMIDRVHRDAAHVRALAQPPAAPRLADRHVLMIEVADLADRRDALDVDLANLARGHAHRRVVA